MRYRIVGLIVAVAAVLYAFPGRPEAQASSTKLNVVVICVKCIPDDMPQEAYNAGNILLDQNTGDLWFYPALSPGVKPRKLGTLPAIGQPLGKPSN